jgi:predicted nucleotidyltransferase
MLTRNAAIEIVGNYAHEIEAKGVHLQMVILYGSFAKGTQHEWSDIDVALVADEFTGLPDDHDLFPYIGIKKPYIRIEAITYPTDYFYNSDPFIKKKKKEGIIIFNKKTVENQIVNETVQ